MQSHSFDHNKVSATKHRESAISARDRYVMTVISTACGSLIASTYHFAIWDKVDLLESMSRNK